MYRIRYVALLVALTMAAGFAAPNGGYFSRLYRFSFTPPTSWTQKSHPEAVAIFVEPDGDRPSQRLGSESNREFIERVNRKLKDAGSPEASFRANLTITASKVTPGTSLAQYARETRSRFDGLKYYRILGEKPSRIGGSPAVLRSMRINLADGGSVSTRELIVVRGNTALSFALTSAPDSFGRHSAEFDVAMATLKWK